MSILNDLSVIEISANGGAALAARHFAAWGAQVTVLEPLPGTPLRHEPPYYESSGERRSATWEWLSRGKTTTKLDASNARALCAKAGLVLVDSDLASAVLGLAPAGVRLQFEGKTACVLISAFATDGPYADYAASDLGINALGGWMSVMGTPDREPLGAGRNVIARIAGIYAFVAALVALRHERLGGAPQFVDVSMQAVAASMISAPWLIKSMAGFEYERTGNAWPMGAMECADGFAGIPPLTAAHWELLCQLLGIEDVLEHPKGRDPAYRARHSAELYERVKPWLRERSRQEIFEEAQAWRLPAVPVESVSERLECPQLAARGFWETTRIEGRDVKVPRVPYRITGLQPVELAARREREHVDIEEAARSQPGDAPALPFAGVRVLDLTTFWSGPSATSLLGALGADVIKIESVQRPDPYRYQIVSMAQEQWWERSPVWNDCNTNKRGVTLDLVSEDGRALFERLVEHSDVVVSNFSNRVMPNLGLTNKRLIEINPNVIAVAMPGYGTGGPWEHYVGYAIPFELLIYASMTGYRDGPAVYGGGFCDPVVGMHVVAAVELALRQREATGRGIEVEIPQCEVLESLFAPEQIAVQLGAPEPSRRGNRHEWMAPHGAFRVAGDDEWITIAAASDAEYGALAHALGLPRDDRFAAAESRKQHEDALEEMIARACAERDGTELEQTLQAAGVKACRVVKGYRLAEDAGLQHAGLFERLQRDVSGEHPYKRWPFRFSGIDTTHKRPPPLLGEHNDDVLSELPGLSQAELTRLREARVIGDEPLGA
ncbi:MAG: CoA transferase [Dehalococcoidia bacterium]